MSNGICETNFIFKNNLSLITLNQNSLARCDFQGHNNKFSKNSKLLEMIKNLIFDKFETDLNISESLNQELERITIVKENEGKSIPIYSVYNSNYILPPIIGVNYNDNQEKIYSIIYPNMDIFRDDRVSLNLDIIIDDFNRCIYDKDFSNIYYFGYEQNKLVLSECGETISGAFNFFFKYLGMLINGYLFNTEIIENPFYDFNHYEVYQNIFLNTEYLCENSTLDNQKIKQKLFELSSGERISINLTQNDKKHFEYNNFIFYTNTNMNIYTCPDGNNSRKNNFEKALHENLGKTSLLIKMILLRKFSIRDKSFILLYTDDYNLKLRAYDMFIDYSNVEKSVIYSQNEYTVDISSELSNRMLIEGVEKFNNNIFSLILEKTEIQNSIKRSNAIDYEKKFNNAFLVFGFIISIILPYDSIKSILTDYNMVEYSKIVHILFILIGIFFIGIIKRNSIKKFLTTKINKFKKEK